MNDIRSALKNRILIIDGAMGTMIQRYKLEEADYRGERFKDWHSDVKGNNDLLSITQPQIIEAIHEQYLEAGADIIETNTFSSTVIAQADYDMQAIAYEMNVASARCARNAADKYTAKDPSKQRYVAGAIGPLNKTLSLSPDVNNPGFRAVTFDEVAAAYTEQIKGMMSGGQLLSGHGGMAGEVGHITVDPTGIRCGCGNRGCLETLATDSALVRKMSERIGQPLTVETAASQLAATPAEFQSDVECVSEYLAIAMAAVINIFNPTTLFVHGTLLVAAEDRFAHVLERVRQRTLTASLADCTIVPTRLSKRQGAIAGIMHHLTNTWAPPFR